MTVETGRRPADPPFPRCMRLPGRVVPLRADRRMPLRDRRLILSVITRTCAKFAAEQAAGRLDGETRRYLGALRGFVLGRGRSGQDRGVFTFGLADVRASQDVEYWSSALVHDGVHAWLQARARRYRDEVGPCEAQIAYLSRTGAAEGLIRHIAAFRDSRTRQRSRWREPT